MCVGFFLLLILSRKHIAYACTTISNILSTWSGNRITGNNQNTSDFRCLMVIPDEVHMIHTAKKYICIAKTMEAFDYLSLAWKVYIWNPKFSSSYSCFYYLHVYPQILNGLQRIHLTCMSIDCVLHLDIFNFLLSPRGNCLCVPYSLLLTVDSIWQNTESKFLAAVMKKKKKKRFPPRQLYAGF